MHMILHFQSDAHIWFRHIEMHEVRPSDKVVDFKARLATEYSLNAESLTVINGTNVRDDSMTLADDDFEPNAPNDRCIIHVKVEDLTAKKTIRERVAEGHTLRIPLDEVTIRAPQLDS
eukprot:m.70025 g.70025  ORF g.70025 m.70025 type:complete len:118 (-) comp16049_c0_seq2:64-417(-)